MICLCFLMAVGGCVQRERKEIFRADSTVQNAGAINLNTASLDELKKLPGVGESLAREIIEYREQNGKFRRPEQLLAVEGMGEKKFRELRPFIKTE